MDTEVWKHNLHILKSKADEEVCHILCLMVSFVLCSMLSLPHLHKFVFIYCFFRSAITFFCGRFLEDYLVINFLDFSLAPRAQVYSTVVGCVNFFCLLRTVADLKLTSAKRPISDMTFFILCSFQLACSFNHCLHYMKFSSYHIFVAVQYQFSVMHILNAKMIT